jgi:hypothetical protein
MNRIFGYRRARLKRWRSSLPFSRSIFRFTGLPILNAASGTTEWRLPGAARPYDRHAARLEIPPDVLVRADEVIE